jgi:flagellar biosynthesis/type III secretory pathway protein FliH
MEDVTKMEGYHENSFHKGFEEGHEVGFEEGYKRGQLLAISEFMSMSQNAYLAVSKSLEE